MHTQWEFRILSGSHQARFKEIKVEPNCHGALVVHRAQGTRVSGSHVPVTNERRCLLPGLKAPYEWNRYNHFFSPVLEVVRTKPETSEKRFGESVKQCEVPTANRPDASLKRTAEKWVQQGTLEDIDSMAIE